MKSDLQPLICVVLTLTCTAILVLFTDVERDLMRKLELQHGCDLRRDSIRRL